MFIETEGTPNPATLKFLPGQDVMGTGTADFSNEQAAARKPARHRHFRPAGCDPRVPRRRFRHPVTKDDELSWCQALNAAGARRDNGTFPWPAGRWWKLHGCRSRRGPRCRKIRRSSTRSRSCWTPACARRCASDGGDIVFRGYRDGVVRLHMQGACSGCPSSSATPEAWHREHAEALRARGSAGRAGDVLTRLRAVCRNSYTATSFDIERKDVSWPLDDAALDSLFREARSHNKFTDQPVTDDELKAVFDLMKQGPTSANCSPARFLFVRTREGKGEAGPGHSPPATLTRR